MLHCFTNPSFVLNTLKLLALLPNVSTISTALCHPDELSKLLLDRCFDNDSPCLISSSGVNILRSSQKCSNICRISLLLGEFDLSLSMHRRSGNQSRVKRFRINRKDSICVSRMHSPSNIAYEICSII